jgi:MFS family permease
VKRGGGLVPLYAASAVLTLGEGSFQLLVPPYMHQHHLSEVLIGTVFSVYGIVALATRIPTAALYRPERAWALVVGGTVLSSIAFAALTQTTNPALLTLFVALDGAGFAISTTANMAALLERRPEGSNAGSIMGWYTGAIAVGYAAAGFVGGVAGDALGPGRAILVLSLLPVLAGAGLAAVVGATAPVRTARPETRGRWWREFHGLPGFVWLAFFVTLYINLVSGVVLTFLPIYGLAIGLSLTQVGVLQGVHGGAAAVVRFLSGLVFRVVSYQRTLPAMVVASGISVAVIGSLRAFLALGVACAVLGLTRGLLRVASGALVMDEAGDRSGAASGVYLAGLDLGKVLGPIGGGVGADLVGIRTTFLIASVGFPLAYFVLAALTSRRRGAGSLDSVHGRA